MLSYSDKFFSTSPKAAVVLENKLVEYQKERFNQAKNEEEEDRFIDETSIPDEDELNEDFKEPDLSFMNNNHMDLIKYHDKHMMISYKKISLIENQF